MEEAIYYGYAYIGGRGVNFLQYHGISGHRLQDIHSSRIYPDRPHRRGVYSSFSTLSYSYVVAYIIHMHYIDLA